MTQAKDIKVEYIMISCEYIEMCESGCQMISAAVNGETATKDPLYVGPNNVKKHFKLVTDDKIYEFIKNKGNFSVRDTLRFREEAGFTLVNIRWEILLV